MRRRGFTLIELLVIIAIIGAMVTVGVVSLTAGRGAVRVKGATRDIFAAIRQARSVALVTQQPAIITYSVEEGEGEPLAKVEITSAKLFSKPLDRSTIRTLRGDRLSPEVHSLTTADGAGASDDESDPSLIEEVLFAPISEEVTRGMRLKVLTGDALLQETAGEARKSQISIFSTADYLIDRFNQSKKAAEKKSQEEKKSSVSSAPVAETQAPVKIVWEANGRVEPHRVYVYADGQRPEDGLAIHIDRFGAAKVLSGDGREEGR